MINSYGVRGKDDSHFNRSTQASKPPSTEVKRARSRTVSTKPTPEEMEKINKASKVIEEMRQTKASSPASIPKAKKKDGNSSSQTVNTSHTNPGSFKISVSRDAFFEALSGKALSGEDEDTNVTSPHLPSPPPSNPAPRKNSLRRFASKLSVSPPKTANSSLINNPKKSSLKKSSPTSSANLTVIASSALPKSPSGSPKNSSPISSTEIVTPLSLSNPASPTKIPSDSNLKKSSLTSSTNLTALISDPSSNPLKTKVSEFIQTEKTYNKQLQLLIEALRFLKGETENEQDKRTKFFKRLSGEGLQQKGEKALNSIYDQALILKQYSDSLIEVLEVLPKDNENDVAFILPLAKFFNTRQFDIFKFRPYSDYSSFQRNLEVKYRIRLIKRTNKLIEKNIDKNSNLNLSQANHLPSFLDLLADVTFRRLSAYKSFIEDICSKVKERTDAVWGTLETDQIFDQMLSKVNTSATLVFLEQKVNEFIESEETYNKQLKLLIGVLQPWVSSNKEPLKEDDGWLKDFNNWKGIFQQAKDMKKLGRDSQEELVLNAFMEQALKIMEGKVEIREQTFLKDILEKAKKMEVFSNVLVLTINTLKNEEINHVTLPLMRVLAGCHFSVFEDTGSVYFNYLKFQGDFPSELKTKLDEKKSEKIKKEYEERKNELNLDRNNVVGFDSLAAASVQRFPRYGLFVKEIIDKMKKLRETSGGKWGDLEADKIFDTALDNLGKACDNMNENTPKERTSKNGGNKDPNSIAETSKDSLDASKSLASSTTTTSTVVA